MAISERIRSAIELVASANKNGVRVRSLTSTSLLHRHLVAWPSSISVVFVVAMALHALLVVAMVKAANLTIAWFVAVILQHACAPSTRPTNYRRWIAFCLITLWIELLCVSKTASTYSQTHFTNSLALMFTHHLIWCNKFVTCVVFDFVWITTLTS